jgi:aconitase A
MPTEFGGARSQLALDDGDVAIHRLGWLAEQGIGDVDGLPYTLKILLEDLLRRVGGRGGSSQTTPKPLSSPSCRGAS